VASRDFFAFCTALKPLELKAMGQLSSVKHLAEGEVVYSAGDSPDALYIVSRGILRADEEDVRPAGAATYFSRGDTFGDIEVFAKMSRFQRITACETASVRSVPSNNLAELMCRVPTFFGFLCEQLAARLVRARALAAAQTHDLELSGSLANFDLVTVFQTIRNSRQTGELRIVDLSKEPVATFLFENGEPRSGQFQHLIGEEALWQLFLHDEIPGTFSFSSQRDLLGGCIAGATITGTSDDLLINALQGRDEFDALSRTMAKETLVSRQQLNFSWPGDADPGLQPIAEQVWQVTYNKAASLDALYQQCNASRLKIYRVVDTLVRSGQLALDVPNGADAFAVG
jgi:CRP-like cAMP-binding protein